MRRLGSRSPLLTLSGPTAMSRVFLCFRGQADERGCVAPPPSDESGHLCHRRRSYVVMHNPTLPAIPAIAISGVCRELVQQNLRVLEVREIEALAERAVDRCQHRARFAVHPLAAPKLGEAHGG